MPPTINNCYSQAGNKRVSSAALKKFKGLIFIWAVHNRPSIVELKNEIDLILPNKKICLSFHFKFPPKKLKIKNSNTPKKLDTSNRIKPAEDAITDLLGFDDRHVFKLQAEKVETKEEKEHFDVLIYSY